MLQEIERGPVALFGRRKAVTLVEIMMAIVIIAIAVLPAIGTFSRYYGLASRQFDQELALKISEAAMNQLLAYKYSAFSNNETFVVPLNFQTPEGSVTGNLNFTGGAGTSGPIKIGNVTYQLNAAVEKVFIAQNIQTPHNNALEFKYPVDPAHCPFPLPPPPPPPAPPPVAAVASYSCFDDLVMIKLTVDFGGPKDHFELISFRADMNE